jgi:hypothetical protein
LGTLFVFATVAVTYGVAFPIRERIVEALGWPNVPRALLIIPAVAIGFGFWVGVNKVCEAMHISFVKALPDAGGGESPPERSDSSQREASNNPYQSPGVPAGDDEAPAQG